MAEALFQVELLMHGYRLCHEMPLAQVVIALSLTLPLPFLVNIASHIANIENSSQFSHKNIKINYLNFIVLYKSEHLVRAMQTKY